MKLKNLINNKNILKNNIDISGLSEDSREIKKNYIFFYKNTPNNKEKYIAEAIKNGAKVIIYCEKILLNKEKYKKKCEFYKTDDMDTLMSEISRKFYKIKDKDSKIIGITGTNGKSTVAIYIAQLLKLQKEKCGIIGTLGNGIYPVLKDKKLTTPNIINIKVGIIKNKMGRLADLETAPFPDYSLFEEHAIYRAMQGKIRRTIGLETQRGCTYTCAYCNSPSQVKLHKSEIGQMFARKKSIKRVRDELEFLHKKFDLELIYFLDDTFLALSEKRFDELAEMYMDFKIPFWMNTRCETMTEKRAEKLEDMNMLRMSFGIEHGNEQYRKDVLKRSLTNDRMRTAFELTSGKKYITNGNCIIGMPEENRELVFDSVKFTRTLPEDVEKTGAFIFAPYHGTPLRDLAVERGYIKDPDSICDITRPEDSMLDQPQLPKEELVGLARTFGLYQTLPQSQWKYIKEAEGDTKNAADLRKKLLKDYADQEGKTIMQPDTIDA